MLLGGADINEIKIVKAQLKEYFEMKDLGTAKRILGMDIVRDRSNIKLWLFQTDYIQKILKEFKIENLRKASTPLATHFKLSED